MPDMSAAEKRRIKLDRLVETEGYPNLEELLADASVDSACPGICQNERRSDQVTLDEVEKIVV